MDQFDIRHLTFGCASAFPSFRLTVPADAGLLLFLIRDISRLVNSSYEKKMGRTKRWSEDMQARFPDGTFDRIEAVLENGEDRTDFVRAAVERELKRRERRS